MNLILIGFKGVGKSYFGRLFADHLGIPLIDTDRRIEERYKGLPIFDIYEKLGEEGFRLLEKEIIHAIREKRSVIATGGGAILDPDNRHFLKSIGKVVYLYLPQKILQARIEQGRKPDYLKNITYEEHFSSREKLYRKHADLVLELEKGKREAMLSVDQAFNNN